MHKVIKRSKTQNIHDLTQILNSLDSQIDNHDHSSRQTTQSYSKNNRTSKGLQLQFDVDQSKVQKMTQVFSKDYSQIGLKWGNVQTGEITVQEFTKLYSPIDSEFIAQMLKNSKTLTGTYLTSSIFMISPQKNSKCQKSVLVFQTGLIYQGILEGQKRHGKGSYFDPKIGWYKGDFQNDLKHGYGVQTQFKKDCYQGQLQNGLRHGYGTYSDVDGNFYEGSWKLGIVHGIGLLKTNESIYKGQFVNWLKHGKGEEKFANGNIFKGIYQNGRFDGNGTYFWKNEDAFYEGGFKNGFRHGKGRWQQGQTLYQGNYTEGLKEGYGELYFPSKNFYKGSFRKDKREGYGEMFWADGSFYKGQWKEGIMNGKGQSYFKDDEVISGVFKKGTLIQIIPSINEKSLELSDFQIGNVFGAKGPTQTQSTKKRTYSERKQINVRQKLNKIEDCQKDKRNSMSFEGRTFYKSVTKTEQSLKEQKLKFVKKFDNFRLKKKAQKINNNITHRKQQINDF